MPVPIHNRPPSRPPSSGPSSRPSSALSITGGPNLGTTSRRGGRNRARSPAVNSNSRLDQNPSSAAAAAAATAKAYSNGGAPWGGRREVYKYPQGYEWKQDGGRYYHHDPRYHERYHRSTYSEHRGGATEYLHPRDNNGLDGSRTTALVIGGPTPIHVPKRDDKEGGDLSSPKRSSVSSVFRGHPENGSHGSLNTRATEDVDKPLSLELSSFNRQYNDVKPAALDNTEEFPMETAPDSMLEVRSHHLLKTSKFTLFLTNAPQLERTPEGSRNSGSIDVAPSFNLFNQSFDSLGDVQINLDSSLHADSFGLPRTASVGEANSQIFQSKGSAAPFPGPLLAHSNSGQLSRIGSGMLGVNYSPVMSFGGSGGGVSRKPSSGSDVMILGGHGHLGNSSIQMVGMHHGGQSAYGRPSDEKTLKLSHSGLVDTPSPKDTSYTFYDFLKKYKFAFKGCTFLLPDLKDALAVQEQKPVPLSADGLYDGEEKKSDDSESWDISDKADDLASRPPRDKSSSYSVIPEADMQIARRRVESSICAFGGNVRRYSQLGKADADPNLAFKAKYAKSLSGRYYENESRLSWELEESPPIVVKMADATTNQAHKSDLHNEDDELEGLRHSPTGNVCRPITVRGDESGGEAQSDSGAQQKTRYRCKLCGKPKTNHKCPFEQSLARTIGVMVYPAVNAFAAEEPGAIAPSLTDMNNFMDSKEEKERKQNRSDEASASSSPSRPSPSRSLSSSPMGNQVTPDSFLRSEMMGGRPKETFPYMKQNKRKFNVVAHDKHDFLFVDTMPLKSEQFRMISCDFSDSTRPFEYPSLPLPYAQRKKLSDNLYSLSNRVPKLTDECAVVLREAREKDQWDLAVAELMTQAIVILHCRDGDHQFSGLKEYLLTLGIAC